jgi:arylsulfatase A-like enzyme
MMIQDLPHIRIESRSDEPMVSMPTATARACPSPGGGRSTRVSPVVVPIETMPSGARRVQLGRFVVVAGFVFAVALACHNGDAGPGGHHGRLVVYQNLVDLVRAEGEDDRIVTSNFGDELRLLTAVESLPSETVEWPLVVPERGALLELAVRAVPASSRESAAARARIVLEDEGGRRPDLAERALSTAVDRPFASATLSVPLDAFAGQPVHWGHPVVLERVDFAPPPVVLVCVDTLRRDHVDAYGELGLTPQLAAFAREGVTFRRAIASSSWTLPSVATVMTGLAPSVHQAGKRVTVKKDVTEAEYLRYRDVERGFVRFFGGEIYRMSRLNDDVATLAEVLRSRYLTHSVNSNIALSAVGNVLSQGFDSQVYQSMLSGAEVTRRALEWSEAHRDSLFFIYAHYMEPHEWQYRRLRKNEVPDDLDADRAAYRRLVEHADAFVGDLFDGLRRLGLYDDALVIFYSDHGEHFWDDLTGKLTGHGNTMHHVAIDVPLLVKFPHGRFAGTEVVAPVKLADVFATVLEAAEQRPPEQGAVDLVSLRAAAAGELPPEPRFFVSEYNVKLFDQLAVQRGDYKAVNLVASGGWQLRAAETDRVLDPTEPEHAVAFGALHAQVRRHREHAARAGRAPRAIEVTSREMENLRMLGYIE